MNKQNPPISSMTLSLALDPFMNKFAKLNADHKCEICSGYLKKGQIAFGEGFARVCLSCFPKYQQSVERIFNIRKKKLLKLQKVLSKNKDKYLKHNILMELKNENN